MTETEIKKYVMQDEHLGGIRDTGHTFKGFAIYEGLPYSKYADQYIGLYDFFLVKDDIIRKATANEIDMILDIINNADEDFDDTSEDA